MEKAPHCCNNCSESIKQLRKSLSESKDKNLKNFDLAIDAAADKNKGVKKEEMHYDLTLTVCPLFLSDFVV